MNWRTGLLLGSVVAVLAIVLWIAIGKAKAGVERRKCVENLKQLNMAWALSVNADSTPMTTLTLTNFVTDPKVFICPSDKSRQNVNTLDDLMDQRSSYTYEGWIPSPVKSLPENGANSIVLRCSRHDIVVLTDGSAHMGTRFLTNSQSKLSEAMQAPREQ